MQTRERFRRARLGMITVIALATGATGCRDRSVEPSPLDVRYTLVAVDTAALPALVFDDTIRITTESFHLRIVASSGTLTLSEGDRYTVVVALSVTVDGLPQPSRDWRDRGVYRETAAGLSFDSDLVQNIHFEGVRSGTDIVIAHDVGGEGHASQLRFRLSD